MTSAHAVRVAEASSIPLAVIRRTVRASELSRVVPECCGLVWNAVKAQRARGGRHVALYLDDRIRIEVGVELLGPFIEQDGVVRSATPAGLVVSTTHFGPYASLAAAHNAIHAWVAAADYRKAGPRWEIYGHWLPEWDADPSLIRTDVFYAIEPRDAPER